ncbi:MAG: HINT domain-containing protein, partial [Myxococcales bacterium]|nr:HINT domain-containing protein [Myxococcales bacterium]
QVMHLGARHLALRDGMWMQPEPLLHLGPMAGDLSLPVAYSSLYAAGDTNASHDRSGFSNGSFLSLAQLLVLSSESDSAQEWDGTFNYEPDDWAYVKDVAVAEVILTASNLIPGPEEVLLSTWITRGGLSQMAARGGVAAGGEAARGLTRTGAPRVAKSPCNCFVESVEVVMVDTARPIREVSVGDVVVAAASTDGTEEPWVEVASVADWDAWSPRGVCNRVTSWAKPWAAPTMMLACGQTPVVPAADELVQVYDTRTASWAEANGAELVAGDTWLDRGHLFRWTDDGIEDRGEATVEDLAEAGATWRAETTWLPSTDDWVLVLGEIDTAGHWKLGAVKAGDRFAFQGWVFESADADSDGLLEVRATELVLSRVVETLVRQSDTVIDAEIRYDDGSVGVIAGTPEHPFYVPAMGTWVALGELVEGTQLYVDLDVGANLVGKTWKKGDFTVYNFEVENHHNYFVQAPGSESTAVLVHNMCFRGSLRRNAGSFLRNKQNHISNQAAAGGNRGVSGSVSASDAERLGQAWVGDGAREFGDGMGLISADGTRVFRRPSAKRGVNPATGEPWSNTGVQSNFEVRSQNADGKWKIDANVHLDVEK